MTSIFPSLAGDLFDLDEAISTLRSYSLINRNSDLKIISIHRLVQAVLKENLDQSTQKQWIKNVTKAINHFFPPVYVHTWDKCQKYLPHARYCLTQIGQFKLSSPEAANLSRKVGRYFYDQYLFPEAEASYTQALQIINELFGTENTFRMEICRGLAKVYDHQENFEKAKTLLINALGIAQKKLNFDHLKRALILCDLAVIYEEQCEYEKAEETFEKFREVLNSGRRYTSIEVAHGVIKLADFHWHRGQFHQAEMLYQNTLTIVEQICGTDHFQTALILDHVAEFYRDQGRYDVAEPLYQRMLVIFEQNFLDLRM